MAFEGLSEKLSAAFKKLRGKGRLSEADVKEAMREIRLALLEADVSYKVVKQFIAQVTERAVGSEVMESLTPAQMVIKIVNEELTALMGGSEERLKMPAHPPAIIMMCGLQGAGKTTHAAKLAYQLKSQGHRPLLVAGDIYRPAAIKHILAFPKWPNIIQIIAIPLAISIYCSLVLFVFITFIPTQFPHFLCLFPISFTSKFANGSIKNTS